jgi:WD40 repeat protein
VAYSPDGRRIVSRSSDCTVRVWDAQTGAPLACLTGHQSGVSSMAYSPDGRRIVSGSLDGTVRVWDAETGAPLACLTGHKKWVWSVAYSADGRRIVSGSADDTVWVWDANSGKCLYVTERSAAVWAILAGEMAVSFRQMDWQGLDTVIEPAAGGEPIAWFPVRLVRIAAHPSGRAWAGSVDKHLYIIQLEGQPLIKRDTETR